MRKNGGQAFPVPGYYSGYETAEAGRNGMSLRDWFAGMAMQGWTFNVANLDDGSTERIAISAYEQADAMLAARDAT